MAGVITSANAVQMARPVSNGKTWMSTVTHSSRNDVWDNCIVLLFWLVKTYVFE